MKLLLLSLYFAIATVKSISTKVYSCFSFYFWLLVREWVEVLIQSMVHTTSTTRAISAAYELEAHTFASS